MCCVKWPCLCGDRRRIICMLKRLVKISEFVGSLYQNIGYTCHVDTGQNLHNHFGKSLLCFLCSYKNFQCFFSSVVMASVINLFNFFKCQLFVLIQSYSGVTTLDRQEKLWGNVKNYVWHHRVSIFAVVQHVKFSSVYILFFTETLSHNNFLIHIRLIR